MSHYSISDLEKLTGIRTHTIRTWEQRYQILTPSRKVSNIRYYTDDQLRRLMNVSVLVNSGIKISQISKMSNQEIYDTIDDIVTTPKVEGLFDHATINQLIHSGLTMDQLQFEYSFANAILRYGIKETYIRIIYPVMLKIGLMWGKAKMIAAQEHFISNLFRQKMLTSIDTLPLPQKNKEKWLLFLPYFESHEIGLLFAHYLIRESDRQVIYLGQNVPTDNLINIISSTEVAHLLSFFVKNVSGNQYQNLLNQLEQLYPQVNILVSGNSRMLGTLELGQQTHWIKSIEELMDNHLTPTSPLNEN